MNTLAIIFAGLSVIYSIVAIFSNNTNTKIQYAFQSLFFLITTVGYRILDVLEKAAS